MAGWGEYPRQHEHELCILREVSAYDLHDVYRRLHGSARQTQDEGWSWCYRNHIKYRFDHLFAGSRCAQYRRSTSTPSVSAISALTRLWKCFLSRRAGKMLSCALITLIMAITVMMMIA